MKGIFSREGCFSQPDKAGHPCIVTPLLTKDQKFAVARDMAKIDVLDLFSGIGAFSLGFRRAGLSPIAFCDIDPFCRSVTLKHWDGITHYEQISDLCGLSLSDIECGRQASGDTQPRLRPDWIVIENSGHTWRRWVPELRRELWIKGYASLPLRVRAADMGGPHERARCFLLAHADSERLRELSWWWQWEGRKMAAEFAKSWPRPPELSGVDDGASRRLDAARRRMLGNSLCPHIPEIIGKAIMEIEK